MPSRGVELAGAYRASFMIGPPTLFMGMMEVPDFRSRVAHLRVVSCGAMGVTPEFIDTAREAFGATVKRTYGSTEAPTVTTTTWQESADRGRDTDGHSVGDAVVPWWSRARCVGCLPGERGEVLLRGPELFVGYGRRSRPSGRAPGVVRHRRPRHPGRWRVADHRRPVQGLIIRAGENIASAEVERVLERHPDVRQAVVVGCPDERVGERVAAFVVGDGAVDVDECRRWFAAQGVARFKTPELVVHVDEIPLLGMGKPDRPTLRDRVARWQGHGRWPRGRSKGEEG